MSFYILNYSCCVVWLTTVLLWFEYNKWCHYLSKTPLILMRFWHDFRLESLLCIRKNTCVQTKGNTSTVLFVVVNDNVKQNAVSCLWEEHRVPVLDELLKSALSDGLQGHYLKMLLFKNIWITRDSIFTFGCSWTS